MCVWRRLLYTVSTQSHKYRVAVGCVTDNNVLCKMQKGMTDELENIWMPIEMIM